MVAVGNGNLLGLEIVTVIALVAPWPILAVIGWIFYRAARADSIQEHAAKAAEQELPVDAG